MCSHKLNVAMSCSKAQMCFRHGMRFLVLHTKAVLHFFNARETQRPRWEREGPHCCAFRAKTPPASAQGPEIRLNRKGRSELGPARCRQADPCGEQRRPRQPLTVYGRAILRGQQARERAPCSSSSGRNEELWSLQTKPCYRCANGSRSVH